MRRDADSLSPRPRRGVAALAWMLTVLLAGQGVVLGQPTTAPAPKAVGAISDQEVHQAIERGLAYLFANRQAAGTWETRYNRWHEGGCSALVALTALTAHRLAELPSLGPTLKYLQGLADRKAPQTVYVRAVRAMVYARMTREDPETFRPLLAKDIQWLLAQQSRSGGWGYGSGYRTTKLRPEWTDASNTQMAVLALREGANAGAPVPAKVWTQIAAYWLQSQNSDGGWGYVPPGAAVMRLRGSSHGSMTAAALASLQISLPGRPPPETPATAADPWPRVGKGLAWLADKYAIDRVPGWVWAAQDQYTYFYLWCMARAYNAAGVRDVAGHDWYPEMARYLLSQQRPDGSWATRAGSPGETPVRTCFAMLALLDGRAPVLVQSLGTPAGTNGPAAALTRWFVAKFRKPTAWAALPADAPAPRYREAPVLLINLRSSEQIAKFPADTIKEHILSGGSVLVNVSIVNSRAALDQMAEVFQKALAPYGYRAGSLGDSHPVWDLYYKIPLEGRPTVTVVQNAVRTPVFILTGNQGHLWARPATATGKASLHLATNIVFYALSMEPPRGRLASRLRPPPTPKALREVTVARVRHAGGSSVCPRALAKVGDVLAEAVSMKIDEVDPVDLSTVPDPAKVHLLWMTGSRDPGLTDAQWQNLKEYVRKGGTVFIDSTVGRKEFIDAVGTKLGETFGQDAMQPIPADDPLVTGRFGGGAGADCTTVRYTPAAQKLAAAKKIDGLIGVRVGGRLGVILSRYGVTGSLTGYSIYGSAAFATPAARRLAANVVLYSLMGP